MPVPAKSFCLVAVRGFSRPPDAFGGCRLNRAGSL
eukprot:CAMPEP_0204047424 /NCGR_PEP_ID=MMETSP0360-20130528/113147_1 /ASSEMBLY_ACC=CAM_ASM_000342 /TAXON_ID=268821 /ORGANISM="Scrippsiella Hangoei, Strain SHTV-5" /LENGTH=34 /DNA_ID= /DNA_START= /DNA_END= /DNA_ORIENTATION=